MEILYPYSWWKKINLAASSITPYPPSGVLRCGAVAPSHVKSGFISTATLLEHALLTQGFMGGSKAGFLHSLQPQNRDSTRANLANTQK
jgi:hypothetical protein